VIYCAGYGLSGLGQCTLRPNKATSGPLIRSVPPSSLLQELTALLICVTLLNKGVNNMAKKEILDKLSIYIPQKKMEEKPVERLIRLSEKRDRSINYLVVDAIIQYLNREEKKA